MNKVVLDASVLLAYLFEETGREYVETLLESGQGIVSSVNYAEVVGKLVDKQMPLASVQLVMDNLELECLPFSEKQAFLAGELRQVSKPLGLSLGDRACIALGIDQNLTILTADRNWIKMTVDCDIQLLR